MENDPAHAKRREDNFASRSEFAKPEVEVASQSVGRTDAPKRARQDEGPLQRSATTGRASSSTAGNDVDMPSIGAGERPLEPSGDDDMVCGLDVCGELDECNIFAKRVRKILPRRCDGCDAPAE